MQRKALADKVMVLGVDGLDPRFAKKLVDEGKMPAFKQLIERGAQREDLVMLGSNPTVTPPQWTTLACGCNPNVHSITQFFRHNPDDYYLGDYNIDSRKCKAEPVWNCTAEAGKKTLVFHWPGSAWPPTSDNENLWVVDGTTPGAVGMGSMIVEKEIFLEADEAFENTTYLKATATGAAEPCVINDLDTEADIKADEVKALGTSQVPGINLTYEDGFGIAIGGPDVHFDHVNSQIKPAKGWANAPEDAKEFILLEAKGLVRRPCLILKNEAGVYDRVEIYKTKKDTTPIATLYVDQPVHGIVDDAYKGEEKKRGSRTMLLLDLKEDGSNLRIFMSGVWNIDDDTLFSPKSLHKTLIENAGPFPPSAQMWNPNSDAYRGMYACWEGVAEWYSRSLHHLIDNEGVEVIFSHYHAIDLQTHCIIRHLAGNKPGHEDVRANVQQWMEEIYQQTDRYIGTFLHYLDEGWTIIVTSDHAQVSPEHTPPLIGDMCRIINAGLMVELGYTVLKKDENGNDTREIDWSKTRAVSQQGNDIFLNIKGRGNQDRGIVDPADQYELEEQIMTDLYGYKDPETGKRVIALALRKKDAILLGYGGDTAGDIFFATAEGYNYDHCDPLSTCYGAGETSASPIFIAAGKGLKEGYTTDRVIRQVDLAPTISVLLGCRYPAQCEGAPAYQIFSEEV